MFVHLFKKIYLVDKNNAPTNLSNIKWDHISNYKNLKMEHPSLLTFYRELMNYKIHGGIDNSSMIILLVDDSDINCFLQDYCNYLGLTYEAYCKLIEHSKYCTKYVDNINEIISCDNDFPFISEEKFVYKPKKIRHDYSLFPSEYAINCLDTKWACDKYNHFRIYDIYNVIKDYQFESYRKGIDIPEIFKKYSNNDQSAKLLNDSQEYDCIKEEFIRIGLNTSLFTTDIEKYINLNTNFGYNINMSFKYNKPLADYLREKRYRIDE